MPLTPQQQRNVDRVRGKYGDEPAAELEQRYLANQPAPVAPPPVAPEPVVREMVGARPPNLPGTTPRQPQFRAPIQSDALKLFAEAKERRAQQLGDRRTSYSAAEVEAAREASRALLQNRTTSGAARRVGNVQEKQGPAAVLAALAPQVQVTREDVEADREHTKRLVRARREGEREGRKAFHTKVLALRPKYTESARRQLQMEDPQTEADGPEVAELSRRMWNRDVRILAPELVENRRQTLGDVGEKLVADTFTTRRPGGRVVESGLAQGLRALNAPWRFVSEPLMQAATYEVDENGEPLDKNDFAYRAEQTLKEHLPGTVAKATLPGFTTLPRPFQASTRTTSGPRAAQQTGDYWQDVAVAIAKGRDATDEFTELPNYVKEWEDKGYPNQPWATGMMVEFMLPLTPAGPLAKGATVGAGAAADALRFVKPGTKLESALRLGESPLKEAQRINAMRAARTELRGVEAPATAVDKAVDAHGVHRAAADTITREMANPRTLKKALNRTTRTTTTVAELEKQAGWAMTSATVRRLVKAAEDADGVVHVPALKRGLQAWEDGVKAADKAGELSDMAKLAFNISVPAARSTGIVASRASKYTSALRKSGVPRISAEAEGWRMAASDVLRQRFLDKAPVDAIFVTPTVMVKKSALESGAVQRVGKEVGTVMTGTFKDGAWVPSDPQAVRRALVQSIGPQKATTSEYWAGVLDRMAAGEDLTELDYTRMFDEVLGDAVVKRLGGEELVFDGPQAQAARRPLERRAGVDRARAGVELLRAVTPEGVQKVVMDAMERPGFVHNTLRKAIPKDVLPPSNLNPARSSMGLRVWVDSLDGEIANIPRRMMKEMAENRKKYGAVEGFQRMIQDYVKRTNKLYVEGGPEVSEFTAWRHVINKFFEDSKSMSDAAFKSVLGIRDATGKLDELPALTPENLAKVIENMRQTPEFAGKGLRGLGPFAKDDLFAAFLSWMVETEVGLAVRGTFREALQKHPELRVDVYNMLDIPADETAAKLGQAMADRGIDHLARAPRADGRTLNSVLNDHMRNIAMRFSDEQRFLLGELLVAHKLSTGDLKATPSSLQSIKHAIGRLLDRARLEDDLKTLGFDLDAEDGKQVVDAAMDMVVNTTLRGTETSVQDMLKLWGAVDTGDELSDAVASINTKFVNIAGQEGLSAMLGHDLAKEIGEIRASVQGGAFERNLAALRVSDKEGMDYALSAMGVLAAGSRRVATSGMLGGILAPNTRFHAINFLTAPAIMAMTLGVPTTLKALGAPRLLNWFQLRLGNADGLAFKARGSGKSWTNRMVQDAIDRNNFRFSQAGFEFANVAIEDMRRVSKLDPSAGKAAGPGTRAWRWVNPANKNFWSTVAEESDNAWRTNVFVTALKMGKTEAEAAELSRKSLLDYGAIPTKEREAVARFIMFYSFSRNMALETVLAAGRNPRTLRNVMFLHREQQERAETWAFGKPWNQTRAWMTHLKDVGGVQQGLAGPANPAMESAAAIGNVMQAIVWGSPDIADVQEGAVDAAFNPTVQLMKDLAGGGDRIPARHVALFMNAGIWNGEYGMAELLDVQHVDDAVDNDRRRAGEGTFHGKQYRMSEKGRRRYYGMLYFAAQVGMRRTIEDYNKLGLATGKATPEGAELPREVAPSPLLFSLGMETSMGVPKGLESQAAVVQKNMNTLREMGK